MPVLIDILKEKQSRPNDLILLRFIRLGTKVKEATHAIIEQLDSRDNAIQFYAALVLANIGSDAKDSVPKLTQKLNEAEKNDLKSVFALALTRIEGIHNEGMEILLELYKDGELASNLKSDFELLLKEYNIDKKLVELERKTRENIRLAEEIRKQLDSVKEEKATLTESEVIDFYELKFAETENLISTIKGVYNDQLRITNDLMQYNRESNVTLQIGGLNQHQLINQIDDLHENPRLTEEQRSKIVGKKSWYVILFVQFVALFSGILVEFFASDIGEFNYIGIIILGILAILTIIISILIAKNKI
ncbi:MAG: hypothetical protein ACTSSB_04085 [Candidatus Heimdallarchaeota archaeon]